MEKVDLSADEKAKIDDVLKAGQADVMAAVAEAQQAPAGQRAAKMADVQRQYNDLVAKVEAEMPASQRPKFEVARATAVVDSSKQRVEAVKAAVASADMTADQKGAAEAAFVEVDKVIDGSTVDAAEAKRPQDVSDLQTYLNQSLGGLQNAMVQGLGRDKAAAIFKDADRAAKAATQPTGK